MTSSFSDTLIVLFYLLTTHSVIYAVTTSVCSLVSSVFVSLQYSVTVKAAKHIDTTLSSTMIANYLSNAIHCMRQNIKSFTACVVENYFLRKKFSNNYISIVNDVEEL